MSKLVEPVVPTFNQFRDLVDNVIMSRDQLIKKYLDPRRDYNDECGYPDTSAITANDYKNLYERNGIAARVVEIMPQESWQVQPLVFEDENKETETAFEEAWMELGRELGGESWYEDDECNPVYEALERADQLSGIGHYGVLLLGLDDGKELYEPAEPRRGQKLLFLRAFDETLAQITRYENDPNNSRFGYPVEYSLTFSSVDENTSGLSQTTVTRKVHWARVIHLADNLGSSEIVGVPRQRPVYNRLLDLTKLYGGSAEMYWRGAFPGLSLETHPQLGGDVEVNTSALRGQLENYMNGLQRYLNLIGMSAKSLAPQVVDPSAQIEVQLDAICIVIATPKRIFMGSERGELASSQDSKAWNRRVQRRQSKYVTPRVIVPFVNRLIQLGVLPVPKQYGLGWPELDALSDTELAAIAVHKTEAMAKYVQGSVENLMLPIDYLTRILGFSKDETTTIIDAVMEEMDEREEEQEQLMEEAAKLAEQQAAAVPPVQQRQGATNAPQSKATQVQGQPAQQR